MSISFIILIFFITSFSIFYTIRTGLWGIDRYQAEYIVPFVILGLYHILVKANGIGILASKLFSFGLIFLFFNNIFIFKNLYRLNKEELTFHGVKIQSELNYNYKEAYKTIKDSGHAGHTFVAGITYGIFPELLNGFTIGEVIATKKLINHQNEMKEPNNLNPMSINPESINASSEIEIVLISDIEQDRMEIIKSLQAYGWTSWKNFRQDRSGTIIYGMIRGESNTKHCDQMLHLEK